MIKNFRFILLLGMIIFFLSSCSDDMTEQPDGTELSVDNGFQFSGYKWVVKETKNIADSRYFCLTNKQNVLSKDGKLTLKLRKIGDLWYGGEITIDTILGFGEYSFDIESNKSSLDENVTFAFTVLNITDDYYEGMTQTGIRFSKYGDKSATNDLEYFLYATDKKFAEVQTPDNPFILSTVSSTHKIGVYPNYLYYSSKASGGFYNEFKALKNSGATIDLADALTFSEATDNLKVIFSLCLAEANEPANNQEIEVEISNFKFSPHVSDITKSNEIK